MEDLTIDVDKKDSRGRTALHLAAESNDFTKVEQLLSQGADVHAKDNENNSPLYLATEKNVDESHFNVIEALLKNVADTDPPSLLQSSLYNVVKRGNLKTVELFLSYYKGDVNAVLISGENLLFPAVAFNHKNWEVAQLLVKLVTEINRQTNCRKETPLHTAAIHNKNESHIKIIELLLTNGADVRVRNRFRRTPIYYLVQTGNFKIIQLYLNFTTDSVVVRESGCNLLFTAIKHNKNPEVLQLLIDLGFDINGSDAEIRRPLHHAAMSNRGDSNFDLAEILLKNGAKINLRDFKAKTPLYHLVAADSNARIILFLDFNADVNTTDIHDCNLLFPAARCNKHKIVRLLIDLGLNVNHANKYGTTALHCAANSRILEQAKIYKCLARKGANLNATDNDGVTPLVEALFRYESSKGDPEVIKMNFEFLLEHTEFNVIHNDVNILTFYYKNSQSYLWKMILEHLAKLKSLNVPVHQDFFDVILKNDKYRDYFKGCEKELLRAKSAKFKESWVSFYNLAVDSRWRLKNYCGNQDLIQEFHESDCFIKFPVYGASMFTNVKKGLKRRDLFDKSMDLLSDCLPIFHPTHLIIRDVLDCILSKKVLSKFCE